MANTVNITVKANDLASKEFKTFEKNAGASLDATSKKARSLESSLKSARGPLLAISGALIGLGVIGLKGASDLEEAMNKVTVTFGESSEEALKFASTAAKTFGISKNSALEYSGTLGTILNASGLMRSETVEMSTALLGLAADMGSFHNASIEETLNAIRSGLVGEVEPLRRFGVLLNQAAVEAKAVEMGLISMGGQMSEADKVQARYALILEKTTDIQGDFSRTQDSLANSVKSAKAQFSDMTAELGVNLIPIATKLVGYLSDAVGWFSRLDPQLKEIIVVIGGVVAAMTTMALILPTLIGTWTAFTGVMAAFGVTSNIALAGIPLLLASIIAGVALLIVKWDEVVQFMKGTGGWILAAFGPLGLAAKLVIDNWQAVMGAVRASFNLIVEVVNDTIDKINLLIATANKVASLWGGKVVDEIEWSMSKWEEAAKKVALATHEQEDGYERLGETVVGTNEVMLQSAETTWSGIAGAYRSAAMSIEEMREHQLNEEQQTWHIYKSDALAHYGEMRRQRAADLAEWRMTQAAKVEVARLAAEAIRAQYAPNAGMGSLIPEGFGSIDTERSGERGLANLASAYLRGSDSLNGGLPPGVEPGSEAAEHFRKWQEDKARVEAERQREAELEGLGETDQAAVPPINIQVEIDGQAVGEAVVEDVNANGGM